MAFLTFVLGISLVGEGAPPSLLRRRDLLQLAGRVLKHCWPTEGRVCTKAGSSDVDTHRCDLSDFSGARFSDI